MEPYHTESLKFFSCHQAKRTIVAGRSRENNNILCVPVLAYVGVTCHGTRHAAATCTVAEARIGYRYSRPPGDWVPRQARFLNPTHIWCYEFEDLVGAVVTSARGAMAGTPLSKVGSKMLENWLLAQTLRTRA